MSEFFNWSSLQIDPWSLDLGFFERIGLIRIKGLSLKIKIQTASYCIIHTVLCTSPTICFWGRIIISGKIIPQKRPLSRSKIFTKIIYKHLWLGRDTLTPPKITRFFSRCSTQCSTRCSTRWSNRCSLWLTQNDSFSHSCLYKEENTWRIMRMKS